MNDELIKDKLMDIYNKMYRHLDPDTGGRQIRLLK